MQKITRELGVETVLGVKTVLGAGIVLGNNIRHNFSVSIRSKDGTRCWNSARNSNRDREQLGNFQNSNYQKILSLELKIDSTKSRRYF